MQRIPGSGESVGKAVASKAETSRKPPLRTRQPRTAAGYTPSMRNGDPVKELPLFPLDLVLFPEMLAPLHIFEDRYRKLVRLCLETGEPFGIVLATGADPETGAVRTAPIGCTARIVHHEPFPDGRSNIHVQGGRRFRIVDHHEAEPWRTGLVEFVDDELPTGNDTDELVAATDASLREYLELQLRRLGQDLGDIDLPDDPSSLGFTACCLLPVENPVKQELLALTDPDERLRRAVALLDDSNRALRNRPLPAAKSFAKIGLERFDRFRCRN